MRPFGAAVEAGDFEAAAGLLAEDVLIDEFMVMVRPLSAAHALAAAMRDQLEQLAGQG